ncbi:MAG: hypothetical protein QW348_01240 [Ignisphaera sp.]
MNVYEPLIMVVLTIAGFMLSRWGSKYGDIFINASNSYLFYVAVPAILVIKIGFTQISYIFAILMLISSLHIILMLVTSFLLFRPLAEPITALSASLSLSMPNSAYLAIPLALILWGDSIYVLPYMIAFNIILPFLTMFLAYITARRMHEKSVYFKSLPVLIGFALALIARILYDAEYGDSTTIVNCIDNLISYSFYLSFIVIGGSIGKLSMKVLKNDIKIVATSCIIKYILSPLLMLLLSFLLLNNFNTSNNLYIHGLILQSIMPPAVINIVLGKVFHLNEELITILLILLTPISIALSLAVWNILI